MDFEKNILNSMLKKMYRIRIFEGEAKKLYKKGLIIGTLHTYIGEEAIAVGSCSAISEKDYIISTHRGHGHCIAKGGDVKKIMAELLGRNTGYCSGMGGSMHIIAPEIGLLCSCGIVGSGIPISVGAGISSKYRRSKQVTLCFFGDGASNQGTFHESINIASLWKLPIIFICENNQYAMTTPVFNVIPTKNICTRASAYGIKGKIVDGNDIFAVYDAVSDSVSKAREGRGPSFIECITSRFDSHCVTIAETRNKKEIEVCKNNDPILRLESKIIREEIFSREDISDIKEEVSKEIEQAVRFALDSSFPKESKLMDFLYY